MRYIKYYESHKWGFFHTPRPRLIWLWPGLHIYTTYFGVANWEHSWPLCRSSLFHVALVIPYGLHVYLAMSTCVSTWQRLLLPPTPSGVCGVLPCNFQYKFKISPLLTWIQLLLAVAIQLATCNRVQYILGKWRTILESCTGQLRLAGSVFCHHTLMTDHSILSATYHFLWVLSHTNDRSLNTVSYLSLSMSTFTK